MAETLTTQMENVGARTQTMRKVILGVLLSAVGGICLYLAFPPVNLWPLDFVAAVPFLVAQHRLLPRKWSKLAPAIAFGLWLWPFLYRIFDIEGAPFYIQHMGLLVAVFTFFTSSERKFHELTGYRWFVLQGVAAWVGFEMIRSFIPFLGTMGFAANPLAGQAWLTQPVSIFSIYGMNLLVILVNFVLAQMIMQWIDRKWEQEDVVPFDRRATRRWVIGAAVVVAAWVSLSLAIYSQQPQGTDMVRVAALQMDLDGPGHQVDEAEQAERLQVLAGLMREAAAEGVEIGVAPEMAFGFDPREQYTAELQALTAETNMYLYFAYAYHSEEGWHNETVLISPNGTFSETYGKQHAFGEPRTVSAGPNPVVDTPYGKLGAIICMDGVFTNSARKTAANGAQLLALPSYDTTVGISEQNWTHFVFRSIENQIPMVNTDRGYYSVITDARGEIVADLRTPEGASGLVVADVALASRNPVYTRLGDLLGWVSLAGFAFFIVFQTVVEKRAGQDEKK